MKINYCDIFKPKTLEVSMRRRRRRDFADKNAQVDMTPMLDIVFILLIFFIVTTSFVKESGFLVEKKTSEKSSDNSSAVIMIHISENEIIYFNNRVIDIERIPAQIEYFIANNKTSTVLVRPHKETKYQLVVSILDQIKPFKDLKIAIGTYAP